jgi:N-glycosidase YbiA
MFSNLSPHPIWVGGRRYDTVEHYYQSMKGTSEAERDWIRNAGTPEEGIQRGRSLGSVASTQDKLSTMYRGVIAKYRQHPPIGELLVSTGERAIHESSPDLFWGFDGTHGEDWLGRILTFVRRQLGHLGDFEEGPLLEILRQTPVIRYQAAAAARQLASGGEAWLVHLIRWQPNLSPAAALRDIVERRILMATPQQRHGYYGVCFSASPVDHLVRRVFFDESRLRTRSEAHQYSPFGIAMRYDCAREMGFWPTLPGAPELRTELPHHLRFLANIHSASECYDYSYEDEWRYPIDLDLSEGPFAVVLPTEHTDGLRFLGTWSYSTQELQQIISASDERFRESG